MPMSPKDMMDAIERNLPAKDRPHARRSGAGPGEEDGPKERKERVPG